MRQFNDDLYSEKTRQQTLIFLYGKTNFLELENDPVF
jgi:hypothetical protein